MRWTMTLVFPLPAPAKTRTRPSVEWIAFSCSLFNKLDQFLSDIAHFCFFCLLSGNDMEFPIEGQMRASRAKSLSDKALESIPFNGIAKATGSGDAETETRGFFPVDTKELAHETLAPFSDG